MATLTFSHFKTLTRLEQTFFGLPTLFTSLFLAAPKGEFFSRPVCLTLIFVAFFSARICGMVCNQFIDTPIDRLNPRTANRLLPSKIVARLEALRLILFSGVIFLAACFLISFICFILGCISLLLIASYSYLKRITPLCHIALGCIHGLSPFLCSIALTHSFSPAICWLSLASCSLIVSSDIYYGMQDVDFDRSYGIYSFPSHYGIFRSELTAIVLQIVYVISLVFLGKVAHFSNTYFILPIGTICILIGFHIARKTRMQAFPKLFFWLNATLSLLLFIVTLIEWL